MAEKDGDRAPLIRAAQSGDPVALVRLIEGCQTEARRYARQHCRASDVDDAVQASLLTVSRQVGHLNFVLAFSSWLFTIIKHECRKLGRWVIRHEPLTDETSTPANPFQEDGSLKIDLARALESLPQHYLQVVLLRDFEELSIPEIAAQLKETPGAIKSRLHRARALVREYLSIK